MRLSIWPDYSIEQNKLLERNGIIKKKEIRLDYFYVV